MRYLVAFFLLLSSLYASNEEAEFWFFFGLNGSKEKQKMFDQSLEQSLKLLRNNFKISSSQIHVLKGKGQVGYNACDFEAIKQESEKIKEAYTSGKKVYVIFYGHALSSALGCKLQLIGDDPWAHDLEKLFPKGNKENPLTFVFATSSSFDFLKSFSQPGRVIISACSKAFKNNEPEFLAVFPSLFDPRSDFDQDGFLSLNESFQSIKAQVKARYYGQGWLQKEFTILDGDGNGQGSRAPLAVDGELADKILLKIESLEIEEDNYDSAE